MRTLTTNALTEKSQGSLVAAKPGYALYYAEAGNETQPYIVYVPKTYDPAKAHALIVFLHGAILARDNYYHHTDPSIADEPIFTTANANNALILFPFAKAGFSWPSSVAANENILKMIAQVKANYNVTSNRVYIGGISMGGSGTYWFINNKASQFAGFYTFSGMPTDLRVSNITKDRPLFTMNAIDDPGCPYDEIHSFYQAHISEAKYWHIGSVATGGHRFIYNPGGQKYVQQTISDLLKQ